LAGFNPTFLEKTRDESETLGIVKPRPPPRVFLGLGVRQETNWDIDAFA
jgi:hypothetical protein